MGSPLAGLEELGRQPPLDQADAGGDQQVDDPGLGRLHDGHLAARAAERRRSPARPGCRPAPRRRARAARRRRSRGSSPRSVAMSPGPPGPAQSDVRPATDVGPNTMPLEPALPEWAVVPTRLPSLRRPPIGFAHRGARAHAPRTRWRPSAGASGSGPPASRATCGSPRTARPCSTTTAWSARACGGGRSPTCTGPTCPSTSPRSRSSTTTSAPTSSCPSTSRTPAAFDRPSSRWRGPPATARSSGSGCATTDWDAGGRRGGDACPTCAWSTPPSCGACPTGPSGGPPRWPRPGIDAVNLHHTDWTGGLTTLFHRFGVLAFGWDAQHDRILDELLDMGIDGVYSDHVDRMVDALARAAAPAEAPEPRAGCARAGRASVERPARGRRRGRRCVSS